MVAMPEALQTILTFLFLYAFMGIFTGIAGKMEAEKRGYSDGFRWGFLLSIPGVLYVIIRGDRPKETPAKQEPKPAPAAPAPEMPKSQPMPQVQEEKTMGDRFDYEKLRKLYYTDKMELTELDLSDVRTTHVKLMYDLFSGCFHIKELDLSHFDCSEVLSMSQMFMDCRELRSLDLRSFDTSSVKTMDRMFMGCRSLTVLDLSHFDFGQVTDLTDMLKDCPSLEEVIVSDTILKAPSAVMAPTGRTVKKTVARDTSEMTPVYADGAQSPSQVYAYSDPYKTVNEPEMLPLPMGSVSEEDRRRTLGLGEKTKLTITAHRKFQKAND